MRTTFRQIVVIGEWKVSQYVLSLFALTFLGACAPATKTLREDPKYAAMSPIEYAIEVAKLHTIGQEPEMILRTAIREESKSFRHLQVHYESKGSVDFFLKDMEAYCKKKGGTWATRASGANEKTGTCAADKRYDVTIYRLAHTPTEYRVVQGNPDIIHLVDVFEFLDNTNATIESEFRRQFVTKDLEMKKIGGSQKWNGLKFYAYVMRDFDAERAERQSRMETDRQQRLENERLAQGRIEMAKPYLGQIKKVGVKICRAFDGITSYSTRMGYNYANLPVKFSVTAYTEKVSDDRIQIRIAGVKSSHSNLNTFEWGGNEIKPNNVIWDEPYDWRPCR